MNHYSLHIHYSEPDRCYVATCPEFPALSAFGDDWEEAADEAKLAVEGAIEIMQEDGIPLPEPHKWIANKG